MSSLGGKDQVALKNQSWHRASPVQCPQRITNADHLSCFLSQEKSKPGFSLVRLFTGQLTLVPPQLRGTGCRKVQLKQAKMVLTSIALVLVVSDSFKTSSIGRYNILTESVSLNFFVINIIILISKVAFSMFLLSSSDTFPDHLSQ